MIHGCPATAARVINVNHGSLLCVSGRDFAKLLTLCKKIKKEKSLNLLKERKSPFLFLDFVFARRNFRPCWYSPPSVSPSDKSHLQPRHLSLVKYIAGGLLRGRLEIMDQKWLSNASNCYLCSHLRALLLCLLKYNRFPEV